MYFVVKSFLRLMFNLFFNTRLVYQADFAKLGKKAVFLTANISTVDALLLMAYLPGRPVFAMPALAAKRWVRFVLKCADVFIIDSTNPLSLKSLTDEVKKGRWAVMVSEGRPDSSGLVPKVYEAPGMVSREAAAPIVPVQMEGVQYSWFSRIKSVDRRPFPRVRITFLKESRVRSGESARETRERVGDYIYRIMQRAHYLSHVEKNESLFAAVMRAAKLYGHKGIKRVGIVEDIDRKPMNYKDVLVRSFALAGPLCGVTRRGEHVGVMLPNSIGTIVTFLGLSAYGRVPAMLNFASGEKNMLNCCKMATVKQVMTSRKFVAAVGLEKVIEGMEQGGVKFRYLEDLAGTITLGGKLAAFLKYKAHYVPDRKGGHGRKCVVLFTSGSEGTPKGVVLSHFNILSNVGQIISTVNIGPGDVLFNALPMFHSFGLMFGLFAPFLLGARVFLYPTPLHYRVIPELCYEVGATIMAAANTFLKNYAKNAHPYDFMTMRLVINGAEVLREDTRMLWIEKFGVRVIQGYGATETTPVLTLCSPAYNRTGSIGKLLPGVEYRLRKIDGVEKGGELVVKGDNVMMGYMKLDNPGKLQPPKDGWYETGDVVEIDGDGYVFIKDRMKRFAKIAGEMVSLTAVENIVRDAYIKDEDLEVAAVGVPSDAKGEQIVVAANRRDLDLSVVAGHVRAAGYSELFAPKLFVYREAIPLLKTGKRDYILLKEQVMAELRIGKK
ncbi:MAG: AMP-binding protein [Rickettsiales bacterium]|jgi:acyl-[acyl-carrier-protein]-phospholipid O-acyltransferase/long-chain-fatty-acid--[acyl-carrier-protein] ligase|nr:AMP-binding protein [Rickettsiales bacterium]